jgi:outer membrane lipoprotein-sorting protein
VKQFKHNQEGLGHVVLIVLVLVVLGAIGFAGYTVFVKNKTTPAAIVADTAATKAAKDECEKENDKDICKFLTSWKSHDKYRMTSTDSSGAKSVFEFDGNKTYMKIEGDMQYEVISIDKTTYTKAGDVWYKQTIKTPDQDVTADAKDDFKEPADDENAAEGKAVYKNLGKEACGSLTCFKYEIVDPEDKDTKQIIWFDDKDYELRKSRTENKDGTSEQTYEYTNVSVKAPSPVKELGENQYIIPGQSEPSTMPSAADYGITQ